MIVLPVCLIALTTFGDEPEGSSFPVLQVVAADAVLVKTSSGPTLIRLAGVAPIAGIAADAYRFLAREHLNSLLKGQSVRSEPAGPMGSSFILHRVSDGMPINHQLIRDGFAAAGKGLIGSRREIYESAERDARGRKVGLWGQGVTTSYDEVRTERRLQNGRVIARQDQLRRERAIARLRQPSSGKYRGTCRGCISPTCKDCDGR